MSALVRYVDPITRGAYYSTTGPLPPGTVQAPGGPKNPILTPYDRAAVQAAQEAAEAVAADAAQVEGWAAAVEMSAEDAEEILATMLASRIRPFTSLSAFTLSQLTYTEGSPYTVYAGDRILIYGVGTLTISPSTATDHSYTTAGGAKATMDQLNLTSPAVGAYRTPLDIAHYAAQGVGTGPVALALHGYTQTSRLAQFDNVGGSIALGGYVLGLRRGNNPIRRVDQPGTYVGDCGFLRCSYDLFTPSVVFDGSISGNVLTVSSMTSGTILPGLYLIWDGEDNGTTVVTQTSGDPGGAGTYTVALRGSTAASQTVSSQEMTALTKSEVLAFYIGRYGEFGWSTDRAQFTTGYSGGFYAFNFTAPNQTGAIMTLGSSSGAVLNILDSVPVSGFGTRTDVVSPANQTSGLRLESAAGGIDIAPASGTTTIRGNISTPNGTSMTITAVGAQLSLNGSSGVRSLAPFQLPVYTTGTLPSAAAFSGHTVRVSDGDSGDPCLAVSDGTSWLRIPYGAAVSAT